MSLAQLGGNKRFLDGLIRDRVIAQEAARLELSASDAEVADRIRKQFTDASGVFVGLDRYKESIVGRYGDVETFERNVRDAIAQEKLKAFVTASVSVSDDEVQENYKRESTTISLSYALLTPEKLAEKIQVSDDELRKLTSNTRLTIAFSNPRRKSVTSSKQEKLARTPDPDKNCARNLNECRQDKQAGVKSSRFF